MYIHTADPIALLYCLLATQLQTLEGWFKNADDNTSFDKAFMKMTVSPPKVKLSQNAEFQRFKCDNCGVIREFLKKCVTGWGLLWMGSCV